MIRTYKVIAFTLAAAIAVNLMAIASTAAGMASEGVKIEVEVVAGLDCQKAADAMYRADEDERISRETDILAHMIYAENGDDSYSEYVKAMEYTGSVALNRVASDRYPDNLEDVIFQHGQYACTWDGGFHKTPSDDAYKVARDLIRNGSKLPGKVLYAAEFKQGHVYDHVAGTYYCY